MPQTLESRIDAAHAALDAIDAATPPDHENTMIGFRLGAGDAEREWHGILEFWRSVLKYKGRVTRNTIAGHQIQWWLKPAAHGFAPPANFVGPNKVIINVGKVKITDPAGQSWIQLGEI